MGKYTDDGTEELPVGVGGIQVEWSFKKNKMRVGKKSALMSSSRVKQMGASSSLI